MITKSRKLHLCYKQKLIYIFRTSASFTMTMIGVIWQRVWSEMDRK